MKPIVVELYFGGRLAGNGLVCSKLCFFMIMYQRPDATSDCRCVSNCITLEIWFETQLIASVNVYTFISALRITEQFKRGRHFDAAFLVYGHSRYEPFQDQLHLVDPLDMQIQ